MGEPFHHVVSPERLKVNPSRARVVYVFCNFPKIEMFHGSGQNAGSRFTRARKLLRPSAG
jgi:hypothetical protein